MFDFLKKLVSKKTKKKVKPAVAPKKAKPAVAPKKAEPKLKKPITNNEETKKEKKGFFSFTEKIKKG